MKSKIRNDKLRHRKARQSRVRKGLSRSDRTWLTVYRSTKHIYAQLVDPADGRTIASVSTRSKDLTGEAILTVGSAFHDILHPSCGIISIGPFGCMPTRLAESILKEKLTTKEKKALNSGNGSDTINHILAQDRKLPFLPIETDGNAFPHIIEARLEAFCLQAKRLNDRMLDM